MITGTQIALQGLKLAPMGNPARKAGQCACCTSPIAVGELASPLTVSSGFMDARAVQNKAAKPILCGSCAPFFAKKAMIKTQKVIASAEGVYPIGKGENRAWFLVHPPKPPFVVVFSDSKLQHLLWRAAVTLDADNWQVQVGPRTMLVRRLLVLRAVEAAHAVIAAHAAGVGGKKKPPASPFLSLDPELGDLNTGRLRPDMRDAARKAGLASEIAILESLGIGEIWAIGAILFRGSVAVASAAIDLTASASDEDEDADPAADASAS